MYDITQFRGVCGEIVAGFLRPSTLLTAFPILIFYLIIGVIFYFSGVGEIFPLNALLLLLVSGYIIGRFVVPASQGELDRGWFCDRATKAAALQFSIRYAVLTFLWLLPTTGVTWLIATIIGDNFLFAATMGPMALFSMGFSGILMGLLFVIFVFAPTISLLFASATDEIRDCFSLDAWRWLLVDRRADVIAFYMAALGGLFLYFMFYFVPFILVLAVAGSLSSELAVALSIFLFTLPITLSPVLIGRLCGSFVAFQDDIADSDDTDQALLQAQLIKDGDSQVSEAAARSMVNQMTEGAAEQQEGATAEQQEGATDEQQGDNPQVNQAQTSANVSTGALNEPPTPELPSSPRTDAKAVSDYVQALSAEQRHARLLQLAQSADESLLGLYETFLLRRHQGEHKPFLSAASLTIMMCFEQQQQALALEIFDQLGKSRFELNLSSHDWRQMSESLRANHQFADSGFARVKASKNNSKLSASLGEDLLHLAQQAKGDSQIKQALKLLQYIVQKMPSDAAAEQASSEIERLKG